MVIGDNIPIRRYKESRAKRTQLLTLTELRESAEKVAEKGVIGKKVTEGTGNDFPLFDDIDSHNSREQRAATSVITVRRE